MKESIVFGLLNGLTISLLAVGLILVYMSGRYVNFAHAQLGVISAQVLGKLVLSAGVTWYIAFPIAIALGGLIGGFCEVVVIRRLKSASSLSMMIATLGLAQVLLAFSYFSWLSPSQVDLISNGYPLPFNPQFQVGGFVLGGQHILILVIVPALAGGLALMLKFTILGKAIRAAS